jgi:DNA polymerase-3 subunit epsilon
MTLNPWHKGVVYAYDTESTGIDPTDARIVTACILEIHPEGRIVEHNWLINPGVPIPQAAADIHGITTQHAEAEGRDPLECLIEIADTFAPAWQAGWPIVSHNAPYDWTLLDHELHRHGLDGLRLLGGPGMVIDTLVLDRALRKGFNRKGQRTLDACATAYRIGLDKAHDAKWDAVAAARIAWRMCELHPDALQVDLHLLQERQAWTHREWADDFGAYLRSVGATDDVKRDWPYTPAQPATGGAIVCGRGA